MSFIFDSGYLFGRSITQPNATPVRFGSLQGIESDVDYKLNRVPLNMQAASLFTIGALGFTFKAKLANINGLILNQLLFGAALSSGSQAVSRDQTGTVPATGPYTVTPTVPNSGTWAQDLGVQYTATGLLLTYTAGTPAQGQYAVSAGTYTFNSADKSAALTFNYLYTAASGNSLSLVNNWQGLAPYFSVVLNTLYNGQQVTWNLNRCVSQNLKLLTVVEKIAIPEFTFQALGDSSGTQGNIGTFSYSD